MGVVPSSFPWSLFLIFLLAVSVVRLSHHPYSVNLSFQDLTFRHIRTLQQENKELRAALEEHQNALELIMSKYRQHVTK